MRAKKLSYAALQRQVHDLQCELARIIAEYSAARDEHSRIEQARVEESAQASSDNKAFAELTLHIQTAHHLLDGMGIINRRGDIQLSLVQRLASMR